MMPPLDRIHSLDRRSKTRYPIACDLEYRVLRGRGPISIGTGQSINISSEGLLFQTKERLAQGTGIELSLHWPVTLDDHIPLMLRLKGSIIRSEADRAVAQISSHEFRLGPRKLRNNLAMVQKSSA